MFVKREKEIQRLRDGNTESNLLSDIICYTNFKWDIRTRSCKVILPFGKYLGMLIKMDFSTKYVYAEGKEFLRLSMLF